MRLCLDIGHDLFKALHPGFEIFNNLQRQFVRIGQIFQVCQAVVFEPKDVEAGFISGNNIVIPIFPPASLGIVFSPGFLTLMPVFGMAKKRRVPIIGTGGMLIAAKKAGLLDRVAPVLDALTNTGYRLSSALCDHILRLAGEKQ
jgi:hypothetical protein